MELNDYQTAIEKFDVFKQSQEKPELTRLDYAFLDKVLGLTGEAGEVADKVKKLLRDQNGRISEADKVALNKELGDLLWYLATTARYLGLTLEEVATTNLQKLDSRLRRGKISGQGDDR